MVPRPLRHGPDDVVNSRSPVHRPRAVVGAIVLSAAPNETNQRPTEAAAGKEVIEMMHPLAIYAVQVHLAELMAEAEANRRAALARNPNKAGLVASLSRSPGTSSARTKPATQLPPPDRSQRPAGLPPSRLASPGPLLRPGSSLQQDARPPPRGGRLGVSGTSSSGARGRPGRRCRRGCVRRGRGRARRRRARRRRAAGRAARAGRGDPSRSSAWTIGPAIGRADGEREHARAGRPRGWRPRWPGPASTAAASSASTPGHEVRHVAADDERGPVEAAVDVGERDQPRREPGERAAVGDGVAHDRRPGARGRPGSAAAARRAR